MDWYYPLIYDIYFDDANVDDNIINSDMNGCDVIIDDFLINKLEVEWKENIEDAQ